MHTTSEGSCWNTRTKKFWIASLFCVRRFFFFCFFLHHFAWHANKAGIKALHKTTLYYSELPTWTFQMNKLLNITWNILFIKQNELDELMMSILVHPLCYRTWAERKKYTEFKPSIIYSPSLQGLWSHTHLVCMWWERESDARLILSYTLTLHHLYFCWIPNRSFERHRPISAETPHQSRERSANRKREIKKSYSGSNPTSTGKVQSCYNNASHFNGNIV